MVQVQKQHCPIKRFAIMEVSVPAVSAIREPLATWYSDHLKCGHRDGGIEFKANLNSNVVRGSHISRIPETAPSSVWVAQDAPGVT